MSDRHLERLTRIFTATRARMSPAERRRVARGTGDALERMEAELTREQAPEVHAVAGLPRPEQATGMLCRLRAHLQAAPA